MPNMTKFAFAAAALLLVAAPAVADDACSITTEGTAKLKDYPAVRAFYDAFSTGNPALVDCAVAPAWTNTPSAPNTPTGAEGLKPQVGGIHTVFSTYSFETEDVVATGDKVVVRSVVTALQSGPFFGVAPTTTPVKFQTIDIHQLDASGKLAKSWHVEDWLSYLLIRGALPVGAK